MKIIHLSDLHLGKRVNAFSMLEDQEYILEQILNIIETERPDAVLIAGDVYDRSVPSEEAVRLFDRFLNRLSEKKQQVFVISGNHDSAGRLSFGAGLMTGSGIHISKEFNGSVTPFVLEDSYGKVSFWCVPFIRPAEIRRFYPEDKIENDTDAIRTVISKTDRDPDSRHVLLAHQFVSGAETSDSETISVGGTDAVDPSVFEGFDYVALGHLHGPQHVSKPTIRYCGSPLKYSFSEMNRSKSVTAAELKEKGSVQIRTLPLVPLHELRQIRGSYDELTARSFYQGTGTDDYLSVILTDEEDIPEAFRRLSQIYPNIMKLEYDNTRTRSSETLSAIRSVENRTPPDLFDEFFEKQNGQRMSDVQRRYAEALFQSIREESL